MLHSTGAAKKIPLVILYPQQLWVHGHYCDILPLTLRATSVVGANFAVGDLAALPTV